MQRALRYKLLILVILEMVLCSASLGQAKAVPDPSSILHTMYLASGGNAWDRIAGADLNGDYNLGGLEGTFHQIIDFHDGRGVFTYDVGTTRGQKGTEKCGRWWVDEKGLVTVQDGPEALADAATRSYEDRNGWFYAAPSIPMTYVGQKVEKNRSFELVRVVPPAGRALTLWIDSATHRLDRVVELDADQRESTTYFSDYRHVDGIWYPFQQRNSTGDPRDDDAMFVTRIRFTQQVRDQDFSPPRSVVRDASLMNHATSTTIPFTLDGGLIIVDVSINGSKPLPFALDSGAPNLLTPEAANKLGVKSEGNLSVNGVGNNPISEYYARVQRYSLGLAELTSQQFIVVPLPRLVTDSGTKEPVAGLIGYEVLRRFIARIDYHRQQLTLSLPSVSAQQPRGDRLPIVFNERSPFVKASVDGVGAYFGIDTGDNGALTLFRAFYTAHNFPIELPGIKSRENGVGGTTSTMLTRVGSLSLGSFTLLRPLTELSFANGGAFSYKLTGGNLGFQVFRNFIMTLDYEHRALYLEKSPDFGYFMPYNGSGVHLDINDSGSIVIKGVNEGSPAALAGIQAGDQLVAIDNRPVRGKAYSYVEDKFEQPADTRLDLDIMRKGKQKHFIITLKQLLPIDGFLQRQR